MSSVNPEQTWIDGHGVTCRELVALVTDYLEDALPDSDRRLFEAHVDGCTGCRRHLHQIRLTLAMTGRLREEDLPAEIRERLLGAFRNWTSTTS